LRPERTDDQGLHQGGGGPTQDKFSPPPPDILTPGELMCERGAPDQA